MQMIIELSRFSVSTGAHSMEKNPIVAGETNSKRSLCSVDSPDCGVLSSL